MTRRVALSIAMLAVLAACGDADVSESTEPTRHAVTRQSLVLAGVNPAENKALIEHLIAVLGSPAFAREWANDLGASADTEEPPETICAHNPAGSALIEITVVSEDQAAAEAASAQVLPTLERMVRANLDDLPVEPATGHPILEELDTRPPKQLRPGEESPCDSSDASDSTATVVPPARAEFFDSISRFTGGIIDRDQSDCVYDKLSETNPALVEQAGSLAQLPPEVEDALAEALAACLGSLSPPLPGPR